MARGPARFGISRYEADEHYQLALDAFKKGRFDVAINHMSNAIELTPGRAELYAARGLMYAEDGVKDKALADFEKALKLYPLEMLAHYGRGMIAYKDRNYDEALAHFTDAYKADPKRPETLYYLALVYHRSGAHDTARRLMEMAAEAFTDSKHKGDAQRWMKELDKILSARIVAKLTAAKTGTPDKP